VETVFEINSEPANDRRTAEILAIATAVPSDRKAWRDDYMVAPMRCNSDSTIAIEAMVGGESRADKWPQPPQKDLAGAELHAKGRRRLHVLDRIEATRFKCDLVGLRRDRRRDHRRDHTTGRDGERLHLLVGSRRRRREH